MIPRFLAGSVLMAMATMIWPGSSHAASKEEIVRRLQKKYEETVDLTADFVQETEVKALGKKVGYTGRVYFKKPSRMRWDYSAPKGQTIVADGKFLWFYQPEEKQVIKTPLDSGFRPSLPVSFLVGLGNLEKDFLIQLLPEDEKVQGDQLKAVPRLGDSGLGELELVVDRKSSEIVEARIKDLAGNLTRIRLSHHQRQVGIKETLFRFKVPTGVDVVDASW